MLSLSSSSSSSSKPSSSWVVVVLMIVMVLHCGGHTTTLFSSERRSSVLVVALSSSPSPSSKCRSSTGSAPFNNAVVDRRQLLLSPASPITTGTATAAAAALVTSFLFPSQAAHAGGLLQFPISKRGPPLKNKYHLMRAGMSELEHDNIYSTNPLFLTNRENQLHPSSGVSMLRKTLISSHLSSSQYIPTVVYHSLAANGMDTGDWLARELKLGRDRLLPEFTYLDPRGIGLWDSSDMSIVEPAIWALDELEAGPEGFGGRPPSHDDGTPNETLHDQFIRLRQFLSLQESRTAGETILIIFPDGTGPALLSCMIAGIPFNKVHVLDMTPGELRLDVTPESIQTMFEQRKDDPDYLAKIEDGKETLIILKHKQMDGTLQEWISLKDRNAEQERKDLDRQLAEHKAREEARAKDRRKAEQARAQAVVEAKQKAEQERQQVVAEQKRQNELHRQALTAKRQAESSTTAVASTSGDISAPFDTSSNTNHGISFVAVAGSTAGLGLLGIGALAAITKRDSVETQRVNGTIANVAIVDSNVNYDSLDDENDYDDKSTAMIDRTATAVDDNENDELNDALYTLEENMIESELAIPTNDMTVSTPEADFNARMEIAEQRLKVALAEAAQIKQQNKNKESSLIDAPNKDRSTTNNYMEDDVVGDAFYQPNYSDDGASDWLKVLVEIRNDEDDGYGLFVEETATAVPTSAVSQTQELVFVNTDTSGEGSVIGKDIRNYTISGRDI